MMTMSSKQTLITSDHPKGRQTVDLFRAAYDKANLDEDGAQRINEHGGEFQAGIRKLLDELSVSDRYANQQVASKYIYPPEYHLKSIQEQIEALLAFSTFKSLDAEWAGNFGQAWYDGLILPDWIEGPLVYVWHEVLGGYHAALDLVLSEISNSPRSFYNYREGELDPAHLRQSMRTVEKERAIKAQQPGDFIIVPNQAGFRHRGRSVLRGREVFIRDEFGLGAVAEGCRALSHPDRYVRWEQLHTDCAGDEFRSAASGEFGKAPLFGFDVRLKFGSGCVVSAFVLYGSSSGFFGSVAS